MREEHGVPLSRLTTMRVGGPAQRLVTVETTDELVDVVREVDDADGGGGVHWTFWMAARAAS